jgi:hypothetical protein
MQGSSTSTGIAFFAGGTSSTGETAAFQVNNQGAVTASNITATGGSVLSSLIKNQPDEPLLIVAGGPDTTFTTQAGAIPASTVGDIGIIGQSSSLLIANQNAYSQAVIGVTLDPGSNPDGANVDQFYGGATGAVYTQTTDQAPGAVDIEYLASRGQRQSSARLISSYANRFLISSVQRSGTTATIRGIGDQLYELILTGAVKVGTSITIDLTLNSPDPTTYAAINGSGKIITAVNATYPGSISYTTATSATLAQTAANGFYDLVDNVASSIETYALNWLDLEIYALERSAEGVVTVYTVFNAGELYPYVEVGSKVYINITGSTYSINEGWQTVTSVSDLEFPSLAGYFTYSSTGGEVWPEVEIEGTASIRNVYSKSGFLIRAGGTTGKVSIGANDYDRVLDIFAQDEVNIVGALKGINVEGSARFSSNGLLSGTVPGDESTTFNMLDYAQFSYPEGIVVGSKVSTDLGGFSYGGAKIAFEAYDDTEEFAQFPAYLYLKENDPASGSSRLAVNTGFEVEGVITGSSAGHSNVMSTFLFERTTALSLSTTDGSGGTKVTYTSGPAIGGFPIGHSAGVITATVAGLYLININLAVQGSTGAYRLFIYTGSTGGTKLAEQEMQPQTNTTRDFISLTYVHYFAEGATFRVVASSTLSSRSILAAGPNKVSVTYLGSGTQYS